MRVIESTRTLTPLPAEAPLASVAASIGRGGRLSAGDERLLFEILGAAQASPSAETLAAAAEARRLIIETHQRLVAVVARPYRHSGVPMADLIQDGNLGLIAAVDRFDPTVGCRFGTFAAYWIRQLILAAIPRQRRGLSLSPAVAKAAHRVRKVRDALEAKLGREATTAEVAEAAQMSAARVRRLESLALPHHALTESVSAITVDAVDDGDPSSAPGVPVAAIRELVDQLPARQRIVICGRYGIGSEVRLLTDLGETLGVSASRVSQIEREALGRLRRLAANRHDVMLVA
ncbi:MAG TPA: sigma-70 family RNA polymerase sigma factor [Acidimicrobiia bacterium]|nr:sigma-70 family RNA polymerase sigma factor [Acidimicrobiia bacterium]